MSGSYFADQVKDYYFTPWDLDYGRLIRFDHDFVGRDALLEMREQPQRRKVSIVVDSADATAVYASQMQPGGNLKAMELPSAHYASYPFDTVLDEQGRQVGVSNYLSFLHPDNCWVALAVVDEEFAEPGSRLTIAWGERPENQRLATVERHHQTHLHGTVRSWPFSTQARTNYRPG